MQPFELVLVLVLVATGIYLMLRQLATAQSERELRESNRFAREIIDNAGEGIVVYDTSVRYVLWNRFMEEMTGLTADEVIGRRAADLFPHIREQHVDVLIERAMAGETVSTPDVHFTVPATGRDGWVSIVYRPHYDGDGNIIGVIGLIRDITERKSAEQQIEYQAYHDALTGLANRRLFQEHLSLALKLAQRRNTLVSVLFLDLDHFKIVNDSLGHSVGDALLRQIAARLKASVREGDTVARVGGDEFTIVLQELQRREDAALVAQKVLHTVAEPVEAAGHKLYVTTSIGVTFFPDDGDDAETLLKNADTAMYRAKSEGRNNYQMSTRELSRSTHERMTVESGLHHAMESGDLELYYQPQIDIETMEIIGIEALLRWHHAERGLVLPDQFIGVAEEGGLILLIGDWVIREACRAVKRFHDRGLSRFRVSVNISPRQFREQGLVAIVTSAIRDAGIDPRMFELEITESMAMENVGLTMSMLAELRAAGVTIAIDDFGTGHSSLSYLKRFPIDALRIDRDFVLDLPDSFEDAAIVSSVISLANGLGLRVVAEGVETEEQLAFLRESGCREVQGFLFSYARPLAEVEDLVARGWNPGAREMETM